MVRIFRVLFGPRWSDTEMINYRIAEPVRYIALLREHIDKPEVHASLTADQFRKDIFSLRSAEYTLSKYLKW